MPDGKRVLFAARRANEGVRLYIQNIDGGKPVAFTKDDVSAPTLQCACVSPGSERVAALDAERRIVLLPLPEGAARLALGVEPGEKPLRWSADGRLLYVGNESKVFRVDPVSGKRELWKSFAPPDPAGVRSDSWFVVLSADSQSYFYSFQTHLSELYLVTGLR
jgi:hypothetical protein